MDATDAIKSAGCAGNTWALDQVTSEESRARQDKLNNRPRKTLGYKTPNDVYDAMKVAS